MIYDNFKVHGDDIISLLQDYKTSWKPNNDIDTKEKAEEYSSKMEKLAKEINCSRDRLEIEYRLHTVYQMERQTDALDSIAESLKALLALRVDR